MPLGQLGAIGRYRALRNADPVDRPVVISDYAETLVGTQILVNLIDNDVPGGGSTVSSAILVARPVYGSAVITNGVLTYTPGAGFQGYDTIGYKVVDADGITSYAGFCTILVTPDVITPPPPPGQYIYWADPVKTGLTPLNSTPATLAGDIAGIDTSRKYILLTGTVNNAFMINSGGTRQWPLVIEGGTFAAGAEIHAPWVWLYKGTYQRLTDTTGAVQFFASNCFVTRCTVPALRGLHVGANTPAITGIHMNYNELTGPTTNDNPNDQQGAQIYLSTDGGGSLPSKIRIGHNWFTQTSLGQAQIDHNNNPGNPAFPGPECHAFHTGPGRISPSGDRTRPTVVNLADTTFEYNRVWSQRTRAIYMKHGITMMRYNDIRSVDSLAGSTWAGGGYNFHLMSTRGQNNTGTKMHYNYIRGDSGGQVGVQCWDHELVGNDLAGGGSYNVYTHCDGGNPKTLLGGNGAKLYGNTGPLSIGVIRAGGSFVQYTACSECAGKVKNVDIAGHSGTISNDAGGTISWSNSGTPTNGGASVNAALVKNYNQGASPMPTWPSGTVTPLTASDAGRTASGVLYDYTVDTY